MSAIKIRQCQSMNLLIGSPSGLAAEYLGKSVDAQTEYIDLEIPPIAEIKGVDLGQRVLSQLIEC